MNQKQNNKQKLAQQWFQKAQEDELSCIAILKEGGAPSTLCFLSQQMAEKYLKGLMVLFNIKLEKVHDLVKLANNLRNYIDNIDDYKEEFTILNRYYTETRYPADFPEGFDIKEGKHAFEMAKTIKDLILDIFNKQN